LLGTFFNLAEAGKFKALMNMASPIGQVFAAISLLTLPYAARAEQRQDPATRSRLGWKLISLYGAGTSAYWLVLLVMRNPIVHVLYGRKYPLVVDLLPWLALGSILRIAATSQSILLRAMNRPDLVFGAYFSACALTLAAGIPAARWFGIRGAVAVWILSSGVALAVAAVAVRRKYISSGAPFPPENRRFEISLSATSPEIPER
jgi:O-antigen/teichoic acid export membrane protein